MLSLAITIFGAISIHHEVVVPTCDGLLITYLLPEGKKTWCSKLSIKSLLRSLQGEALRCLAVNMAESCLYWVLGGPQVHLLGEGLS